MGGVTDGSLPDYQASALLMAVVLRGMTPAETAADRLFPLAPAQQADAQFAKLVAELGDERARPEVRV